MSKIFAPGIVPPTTVPDLFQRAAAAYGGRDALLFKPGFRYQRWTYAELWQQALQAAQLLRERGLEKGDRMLIWGPNTPYWVIAFVGCLCAGGVAVPIDLHSAPDFIERVVGKTRPKVAFVSRFCLTNAARVPALLFLEDLPRLIDGKPESIEIEVAPSDLAEVMFTSGTTGDPKGVMLTHGNLLANLSGSVERIPGKLSDRLISILPLSHMFEQMGGLFLPIQAGANVTYATSRQPSVLSRLMRDRRVTSLLLVPQALELFMKGIEREVERQSKQRVWRLSQAVAGHLPRDLRRVLFRPVLARFGGRLELVVTGGASIDNEVGEKWSRLGVRVIQGYGATEASPVISIQSFDHPRFDNPGPPLSNVEVKIAPDGELLARGPSISPGYWEDAEKTATAFEDGWYKTGDLAVINADGCVEIKGRKKDMIALANGQKVFPEDIEAVLAQNPAFAHSTVVGLPNGGGVEVHAALIMADGAKPEDAVAEVNSHLAEFQRIRGWSLWPEADFPRTPTLKVKKNVVIDVLAGRAKAAKPYTPAPSGRAGEAIGIRTIIARVAAVSRDDVLPAKTLGIDLNCDSLKRVELLSELEEELGIFIEESRIGGETTVAELEKEAGITAQPEKDLPFSGWGRAAWCCAVRSKLQQLLVFPLLARGYRLTVTGDEHLDGLASPVLFAANHSLLYDSGLFMKAFAPSWRDRLAIAGAAELWRSPLWRIANPLFGAAFPVARSGRVRESLENVGKVLDEGWNVLIYPEGELTVGGPIKPFLTGVGLLAAGASVPVVPMRLKIRRFGTPAWLPLLKAGAVEISFGAPIKSEFGSDYAAATAKIEAAVRGL